MTTGRLAATCLLLWATMTTGEGSTGTAAADMARAAEQFLATLGPTERAQARLAFDAEERLTWHFTPGPRGGLPLKAMTPRQRGAAFALLKAGLSEKGYSKAEVVRALEPVLAEIEGNPVRRDPELYYVAIFGDPVPDGTWGWRYEGHHISLNWTVVNGASVASTPQFFGSNPAEVRSGPKKGTRALAGEEDLGRALVEALSEAQRAKAIVERDVPDEILTSNVRRAPRQEDQGIAYSELTPGQRGLLLTLLDEYASAQPKEIAAGRIERLRAAGLDHVKFAWIGDVTRGRPHYYRVQGPTFLVEYDNTQNGANHIHAVWRDFDGDFGADLLDEHYRNSPHHRKP